MEILSKVILNLICAFVGWQVGKYIALYIYVKKQMKNKKYEEENEE